MDEPIDETITHDDCTPSVLEQAEKNGWKSGYYNFGKLEGDGNDYFNPGIVERKDGLWLLVRRSEPHPQGFRFGQNFVFAFKLDETGKNPLMGVRLRWPVPDSSQHFEDPRGFYHERINQTIIGCCTFIWNQDGTWTGAHQCLGAFDHDWICQKLDYPRVGGNPGEMVKITDKSKYEKNWLWFLHEEKLALLYKAKPWMVVRFGETWSETKSYSSEGVGWPYGAIRGGTTPVRIGDLYYTFHHSSLPWRGRYRRYYAGAMAFEAHPPFAPKYITPEPILSGSQNDKWAQRKPLVIFPCGALYRDGTWLITSGVNDLCSAWTEIPHESLLERMVPINKIGEKVFASPGLSPQEQKRAKLRANLAKARAARAAKIAARKAKIAA